MKVTRTDIPNVLILEPRVQQDARGFLLESYNRRTFEGATGLNVDFVQDNTSFSVRNVLRGLHYQIRQPQGKAGPGRGGEIFDVALGLRWPLDGDPIVSDRDRRAPLGRTLRLKILLAGCHGQVGWRRRPGRSCGSAPKDRSTWFLRRCCPVRVRPCRRNENSIDVVEGRIF
jgi:dTDP-4-dehydrorhamnose 3,5-epimerase-like enzyme